MTQRTRTKQKYYECLNCRTQIPADTHKELVSCACGNMAIDGCQDYTRIIGNKKDFNKDDFRVVSR